VTITRPSDVPRAGQETGPGWRTVQSFLDGGTAVSGVLAFPLRDFDGRAAGLLTLGQILRGGPGS
jgi:hypothetical protein